MALGYNSIFLLVHPPADDKPLKVYVVPITSIVILILYDYGYSVIIINMVYTYITKKSAHI